MNINNKKDFYLLQMLKLQPLEDHNEDFLRVKMG